jgi:hypothetical protein
MDSRGSAFNYIYGSSLQYYCNKHPEIRAADAFPVTNPVFSVTILVGTVVTFLFIPSCVCTFYRFGAAALPP